MEPARSAPPGDGAAETLLRELERQVQDVVRASSWWERHGVDCAILALSLLALPAGETGGTGCGWGWRAAEGGAGWKGTSGHQDPGSHLTLQSLAGGVHLMPRWGWEKVRCLKVVEEKVAQGVVDGWGRGE